MLMYNIFPNEYGTRVQLKNKNIRKNSSVTHIHKSHTCY